MARLCCCRSNVSLFLAAMFLGLLMTVYTIRTIQLLGEEEVKEPVPAYNNRRLPRTELIEETSNNKNNDNNNNDNDNGGGTAESSSSPCNCKETGTTMGPSLETNNEQKIYVPTPVHNESHAHFNELPVIFMITPTYKRLTQKVDLIRLCQTLMLVPNVTWIVIEDASTYSKVVTNVLSSCKVRSVHLHEKTTTFVSRRKGGGGHRGVEQRNRGLKWIRDNHGLTNTKMGVVYFGDDDNGYDIRLFHEMRYTSVVSVWPVGFVGMLRYEGPNCKDGKVVGFHTSFRPDRTFPLDMGAFAVNLQILMNRPDVYINHKSAAGMLETTFLSDLEIKPSQLEAKANDCKNIFVWHIKTEKPKMPYERQNPGDKTIEV